MKTFKSWFTGFGGADIGAKAAGLAHLPGREYDPAIAAVSALNGFPSVVGDVRDADCTSEETPWWFHFSPSCKRASTANVNAGEASEDVEVAQACVRAIVALRPPFVSVENVRAYETFRAFRLVVRCLMDEGYNVAWWALNSADYGVPQTRERLFLVASRVAQVRRPIATHAKERTLFSPIWVSWHDAIVDLLRSLPDAELSEWQAKHLPDRLLPENIEFPVLIESQQHNRPISIREQFRPSVVVPGATSPSRWRVIMPNRIVKLTPRCLARFQAFPDWYVLPDKVRLACLGIGNAVPPTMTQVLIEAQSVALQEAA